MISSYLQRLLFEALFVAVTIVPVGLVVTNIISDEDFTTEAYHGMIIGLFATGAVYQLICEATGINTYYRVNSAAAML